MTLLMRGSSGRLLVGYRVAVEIGPFAVESAGDVFGGGGWRLTGSIMSRDDYWSTGDVFDLELDLLGGTTRWCWAGVHASIGDTTVTVSGAGEPRVVE